MPDFFRTADGKVNIHILSKKPKNHRKQEKNKDLVPHSKVFLWYDRKILRR